MVINLLISKKKNIFNQKFRKNIRKLKKMTEQNAVAPAQSFSLCDLWIATRDLLSTVNNNSAEYSKTLTS